jgi:hypothetical protein
VKAVVENRGISDNSYQLVLPIRNFQNFHISKMACFADFPVEKASAFDRQEFLSRM